MASSRICGVLDGTWDFVDDGGGNRTFHKKSSAPDTAFRMTWNITSTNAVTVPGKSGLTYNSVINWGDGSGDKVVTAYNDADLTHSYNPTGTYDIVITGTFPSIYFNNGGSKTCVRNVSNLGDVGWTTFLSAFYGCTSLTNVSGYVDLSGVTDLAQIFVGCTSLKSIDTSAWDVSTITTYLNSFSTCSLLTNIDVSAWDVSKASNMQGMFNQCPVLTTINVSVWDVSKVTKFLSTFAQCRALTSSIVSTLPPLLTTAATMYYNDDEVTGDVSGIINLASNNTTISFYNCDALTYSASNGCFSGNVKHLFNFNWQNATLSAVEGDRLLVDFNTSGATGGVFNTSGADNQKVTVVGTNAKNALVVKGWTVTLP